ncbi:hypothetical protein [Nostoc sp. TCL26-01]|uniref:hypothetical protein n=1 Tax=Nostoc sp. TCL26-01 TaxID=2576904 RepID=UPI0015BD3C4A|nr:hypothetical protein [Nostoc sp. TCL26-01]QLE58030.1 hypothetical protein FD725_22435 [Nostoc sp. TCL26-01]
MAKTNDFTNFANERPNYFPGQYLLEDDFEIQHKYLSDRQRYHHQSLHISGIIEGLEVEVVTNTKSVLVKSGSAINSSGDVIILKANITFSDFKNLTDGELYIQYSQDKQLQQQKDIADSYTRWQEKPIIGFAATTPVNSIKLAKLAIRDTINLDVNIREYSGLSLPNSNSKALTLRSAGNANPNLAILTGSLKIEANLEVNSSIFIKGENTSILGIGDILPEGNSSGNREWMKRGIKLCWNSDNLFLGLKDEGNNRKDAVVAWGDDPQDDLRFINVQSGGSVDGNELVRIKANGNVGIGTNNPGEYKLNVQGNQLLKGSLTIQEGKVNLNGNQQIAFTDIDVTNNLKLQLWTGYGLGINNLTLFYTADGNHSWRDKLNNERMLLTTGADGGLTVKGTGSSTFAGNLTVNGTISGKIDAANIATGQLDVARIPNLPASTITSGELAIERIPNLPASKISTGTITGDLTISGNLQCSNSAVTNILAIGDTPMTGNLGGNREWMTKGMKISWDTDSLFIGLKDEGKNRKDAIIAWGDDPQDDLRFINVQSGGNLDGNEVFRIKANGNVCIGTNNLNDYKLNVQGNQYIAGNLTVTGSLSVGVSVGSTTNIDLSGHVQLKEYGQNNLAYLQARDDSSNRDIGLRIRTQTKGTKERNLVEAVTITAGGEIQGKIWYSDEYTWTNGKADVKMGHSNKCVAFITHVQGKFAGGGEQVFTYIGSDGFWYLGGKQGGGGADVAVKARCIGSP